MSWALDANDKVPVLPLGTEKDLSKERFVPEILEAAFQKVPVGDIAPYALHLPSKAFWWIAFDILFICAFAVGWALTLWLHPQILSDNPILRVFKVNNICVGVDFGPARAAGNIMWGVMLIPASMYVVTSYFNVRQIESERMGKLLVWLLCLGYICTMCFGLSFGIAPNHDDPISVYIHTWGFAMGVLGYAIMRLSEIVLYIQQYPRPWTRDVKIYLGLLGLFFFWIAGAVFPLFHTLLFDDYAALLQEQPPTFEEQARSAMFIEMWIWTVGTFTLPMMTWKFLPPSMHELKVVGSWTQPTGNYEPVEQFHLDGFRETA